MVICYHAVSRTWDHPLAIPPEQLLRQVRALRRFAPLHVTFDDAYANIELVLPELTAMGAPITVFVCTDLADRGGAPLRVSELGEPTPDDIAGLETMSWDQLRTLVTRGIGVASHTASHAHLIDLPDEDVRRELLESKQRIEAELDRPCLDFAYPYGEHDARVRALAAEAGYERAHALEVAAPGPYGLARLGLHRRDGVPRALLKALTLGPRARRYGRARTPVTQPVSGQLS